jgi:hypothetical protein
VILAVSNEEWLLKWGFNYICSLPNTHTHTHTHAHTHTHTHTHTHIHIYIYIYIYYVTLAVSNEEWLKKWGFNYICSLQSAHRQQRCNN